MKMGHFSTLPESPPVATCSFLLRRISPLRHYTAAQKPGMCIKSSRSGSRSPYATLFIYLYTTLLLMHRAELERRRSFHVIHVSFLVRC